MLFFYNSYHFNNTFPTGFCQQKPARPAHNRISYKEKKDIIDLQRAALHILCHSYLAYTAGSIPGCNTAQGISTHTDLYTLKNNESHTETETVEVTAVIVSPTEEDEGSVIYTSDEFSNERFTVQTKVIEIPALKDMSVIQLPGMLEAIERR